MPIKRYPSATNLKVARIKTGTYTGDGSTGLSITGIGFTPIFLWISTRPVSETTQNAIFKINFSAWAGYAIYESSSTYTSYDNRITSIDPDGFTVSDDSLNAFPNASGAVYDYIIIG